jgi:hypothetical protein
MLIIPKLLSSFWVQRYPQTYVMPFPKEGLLPNLAGKSVDHDILLEESYI